MFANINLHYFSRKRVSVAQRWMVCPDKAAEKHWLFGNSSPESVMYTLCCSVKHFQTSNS